MGNDSDISLSTVAHCLADLISLFNNGGEEGRP